MLATLPLNHHMLGAFAGFAGFAGALVWLARRAIRSENRGSARAVLIVAAAALALRVVWVIVFDSYQVSDFGIYLRCGQELMDGQVATCPSMTYLQRALVTTAPVIALLGLDLSAVEAVNVLLFALTAWLYVSLVRRLAGPAVAVVGLALFAFAPDMFYPVTLASHDLHGMVWLLAFFLVLSSLGARLDQWPGPDRWTDTAASLALGVILAMLELSRSYGMMAVVTLFVVTLARFARAVEPTPSGATSRIRSRTRTVVLMLAVPLATMSLATGVADRSLGKHLADPPGLAVGALTAANVLSANEFKDHQAWLRAQFPALLAAGRTDYAWAKLAHELSHSPVATLGHFHRKIGILFDGMGNMNFSIRDESQTGPLDPSRGQVDRTNQVGWQLQDRFGKLLNLWFWGLLLARLLLARAIPFRPGELPVVAFSTVTFFTLLLLTEVQQRYTIFLLIPGTYMAAQALLWALASRGGVALRAGIRPPEWTWPGAVTLAGIGLVTLLGFRAVAASAFALSDLGPSRLMTDGEISSVALSSGTMIGARGTQGQAWIAFNRAGVGFAPSEAPVPPDAAAGVLVALEAPPSGTGMLEGFLVGAPDGWRVEGRLGGSGLEGCLFIEGREFRCSPVESLEAAFLHRQVADLDGDGLIEMAVIVRATRWVEGGVVGGRQAIALEHVRLR